MYDIFTLIGDSKRPLIEGEALFKANHVMLCGLQRNEDYFVKILGLCLQTSAFDQPPHEINIQISQNEAKKTIECLCSCKAGNSKKCKHIVSVLLHINR